MKLLLGGLWVIVLSFPSIPVLAADSPPQVNSYRICTQNLFRYGEKIGKKNFKQRDYLIERFLGARCDVIALQEVYGEDAKQAKRILSSLTTAIKDNSGEEFGYVVGDGFDPHIRNGYLFRYSSARIRNTRSLHNLLLPKLQPIGPNEKHLRDPLVVSLDFVLAAQPQPKKIILVLMNFHLKSKHQGYQDPSGTNFEMVRMQAAESIRNAVLAEAEELKHQQNVIVIPVMLGDRNNHEGSPTDIVMRGELVLDNFGRGGPCKLDMDEEVECSSQVIRAPVQFISLLQHFNQLNSGYSLYTYKYRNERESIDDILILPSQIEYFSKRGRPQVGVYGKFFRGSDHKLVWAEINSTEDSK